MTKALWGSLIVGFGGFAGSMCRYLLSLALQRYAPAVPAGTLTSNLVGCFIIGVLVQLSESTGVIPPNARLALAVGFCGGFTTMSSFAYETAQFVREREFFHAGSYVMATLLGSFALLYLGMFVVRYLLKGTG